jgi:thioredoxin reductase (NADPH)
MTGYHPDPALLTSAGVELDPASLKPRHDPETLETNVPGLFVAGALAAGRETSRIFIENGRFHGEAIVAAIRGR